MNSGQLQDVPLAKKYKPSTTTEMLEGKIRAREDLELKLSLALENLEKAKKVFEELKAEYEVAKNEESLARAIHAEFEKLASK
jgi:hypothetical protein